VTDTNPTEPAVVYIAMRGTYPTGASGHLGDVQAHAQRCEAQFDREPREFRWDETHAGQTWQLMVLNARTGRWGKALVAVHAAPIVDAPCPCGAEPVHQAGCTGGEA
jgi:hypothetical protein